MTDSINQEINQAQIVNIEYDKPKFHRRVLANMIDILLMIFATILCFIATRAVVTSTSMYRNNDYNLKSAYIASSLFINIDDSVGGRDYKYGDEVTVITSYYQKSGKYSYPDIVKKCQQHIDNFFVYLENLEIESAQEVAKSAKRLYDERRLSLVGNVEGHEHYFIKNEQNEIIIPLNESEIPYYSYATYFDNFYRPIIDDEFIDNFFVKYSPNVAKYISNEGKYVVFIEFPIAYILGGILVYFIPPLFFRRGRMTLGKALYRIGLVDANVFSPTFPRFLARFAIFLFAELILSVVTFGIPFLISFTMMLVTKKGQGFPDYLLRLTEIDTSTQKIYYNKIEVLTDKASIYKTPIDFKLP